MRLLSRGSAGAAAEHLRGVRSEGSFRRQPRRISIRWRMGSPRVRENHPSIWASVGHRGEDTLASLRLVLRRGIAYAGDFKVVSHGLGISSMLSSAITHCVTCEHCSQFHVGMIAFLPILRTEPLPSFCVSVQADRLVRGRTPSCLSTCEAPWLQSFAPGSASPKWAWFRRREAARIGCRSDPFCSV